MAARWYNPAVGQFMNRDTAEGQLQLVQQRVPVYALFNRTAATSNRSYVGAVNTDTGEMAFASSGGGPGGCAGHCAEGNALMALGGDPATVMFTEAFTVNRGSDGNYQAVPKPVCAACQSDFPDRSAFAPGVTGAPGGAWGDGG